MRYSYLPVSMRNRGHKPIDTPASYRGYIKPGKPWEEEYMESVRERPYGASIHNHIKNATRLWDDNE